MASETYERSQRTDMAKSELLPAENQTFLREFSKLM